MINDTVHYELAQTVDGTLLKIAVQCRVGHRESHWVTFERVCPTLGEPDEECFLYIYNPSELLVIAQMAMTAWQQLIHANAVSR